MTNLKAHSAVVVVSKLLATMLALAVLPASAPPARGDPPVTEGAGGGTGAGGGVEPPGGITDAPPPEVPNTDGSWTATIGGAEFAGLTEADVGRVLWRGERVSVTYEDGDGMVRSARVCEGFPELTVSGAVVRVRSIDLSVAIGLDAGNCQVEVQSVSSPSLSLSAADGKFAWQIRVPTWNGLAESTAFPIAWQPNRMFGSGSEAAPQVQPVWLTALRSTLTAADGFGFALSPVKVTNQYLPTLLNPMWFDVHCDSFSPLAWRDVGWYIDVCYEEQELREDHIFSLGEGRFHGESSGRWTFSGDTHHVMTAWLSSYRDREVFRCTLSPRSVDGLQIWRHFDPLGEAPIAGDADYTQTFTASLRCRVTEGGFGR